METLTLTSKMDSTHAAAAAADHTEMNFTAQRIAFMFTERWNDESVFGWKNFFEINSITSELTEVNVVPNPANNNQRKHESLVIDSPKPYCTPPKRKMKDEPEEQEEEPPMDSLNKDEQQATPCAGWNSRHRKNLSEPLPVSLREPILKSLASTTDTLPPPYHYPHKKPPSFLYVTMDFLDKNGKVLLDLDSTAMFKVCIG